MSTMWSTATRYEILTLINFRQPIITFAFVLDQTKSLDSLVMFAHY
jgi:hypothetical protein